MVRWRGGGGGRAGGRAGGGSRCLTRCLLTRCLFVCLFVAFMCLCQQGMVCWIIRNLWMLPWSEAKPNDGATVGREGHPGRVAGAGTGKANVYVLQQCALLVLYSYFTCTHTPRLVLFPVVRQWSIHVPDSTDRGWVRL